MKSFFSQKMLPSDVVGEESWVGISFGMENGKSLQRRYKPIINVVCIKAKVSDNYKSESFAQKKVKQKRFTLSQYSE